MNGQPPSPPWSPRDDNKFKVHCHCLAIRINTCEIALEMKTSPVGLFIKCSGCSAWKYNCSRDFELFSHCYYFEHNCVSLSSIVLTNNHTNIFPVSGNVNRKRAYWFELIVFCVQYIFIF